MVNSVVVPKQRKVWIDFIRCFLIILVVIGHSIQYNPTRVNPVTEDIVWRWIYSFHMPLFFMLSGFLQKSCNGDFWGGFRKKANRLLIPYICYVLIYSIYEPTGMGILIDVSNRLTNPSSALWFLWTLFCDITLFSIITLIAYKSKLKENYALSAFVIFALCVGFLSPTNVFGIRTICNYFLYFVLGFFLKKFDILSKISSYTIVLIAAFFIIFAANVVFNLEAAISTIVGGKLLCKLLEISIAVIASLGFLSAFERIESLEFARENRFVNAVLFVGQNTLGIYAIHYLFLHKIFNNICLDVILTILITCFVILVIKRIKPLRFVLLGEK